jgi:hypothetical protein
MQHHIPTLILQSLQVAGLPRYNNITREIATYEAINPSGGDRK